MFNLTDKSILVVDDSEVMRLILVMHLKRLLGVDITQAVNGQDALAKLEQGRFDMILTDMVMPEMDGAGLIREVRMRLKSDIPIVVITTKGESKDRDRGVALGANDYLTKPVDVKALVVTVLKYLGK
jgi:two-component system chemotaxis response regulator CheY